MLMSFHIIENPSLYVLFNIKKFSCLKHINLKKTISVVNCLNNDLHMILNTKTLYGGGAVAQWAKAFVSQAESWPVCSNLSRRSPKS